MVSKLFLSLVLAATQGGSMPVPLPLFPQNNWWNVDISNAPTVADSTVYYTRMGGAGRTMHPDFGGNDEENPGLTYGIPFILVDGAQTKLEVEFVEFPDESDGDGQAFYPVPSEAITQTGWIEGGPPGNVDARDDGDRHMLIVDTTNNDLYELYDVYYNGTQWEASSGAFFDMDTNDRRTEGWTSADAAGLAILPGLIRYDEAYGPHEIRHAFRVTFSTTNGHVYPASHTAGDTSGALPMGARLRLKASKDISSYTPEVQRIFRAMKKYGLIVADNGSNLYVTGTYDTRWNNDILNPAFDDLSVSDFEIIQLGWHPAITFVLSLPSNVGDGDVASATLTAYDTNYNVATGYTGTVRFTSTDGAATLPADYTFTANDQGTKTFSAGFTFQTTGSHVVTVTDLATPTNTGSDGIAVGPPTPTGLTATANGTTQVGLSWIASTGASQYEIQRASATSGFSTLTTTALTNHTDNTATAGTVYVYKVRALDASSFASAYGTPDTATTITFTDDALVAGTTKAKAVHITELRTAANAIRAAAGLGSSTFTDSSLTTIEAVHVTELRTAIEAARAALGMSASTFTDPAINAGSTTVKAAHVQELRTAIK